MKAMTATSETAIKGAVIVRAESLSLRLPASAEQRTLDLLVLRFFDTLFGITPQWSLIFVASLLTISYLLFFPLYQYELV